MSAATAVAKKKIHEARIAARMPIEVQAKIQQAAAVTGSTINEFMVSAALDKANAVLERERVIDLNFESAKIVLDLIANPPEPNAALVRAMQRRRELLGHHTSKHKPRSNKI